MIDSSYYFMLFNVVEKFRLLSRHWFVKSVVTLQAGNFAGTIFQAISGIFIARILQPELFGLYTLAFSLAGLAGLLLGAGTQEAVASLLSSAYSRRDEADVRESLGLLVKINFYAGAITLLILAFLPIISHYFYGDYSIGFYATIVVGGVFLSSSFVAIVQLCLQVVGRIRSLTLLIFFDQFLRFGLSLALVYFGFGVAGGVAGQFFGSMLMVIFSGIVWNNIRKEFDIIPSFSSLVFNLQAVSIKKYFSFISWVAADRNLGNLYMILPIVLTGVYVSSGELSYFKLAFGLVNLALTLLGPISTLLNMEFSKMNIEDSSRLGLNFKKISFYGLLLSTILTFGVVIVSPFVFRFLYGESYLPSIQYAWGLLIYGALYGIGIGLGPMWRTINKVKVSIGINLVVLGIGIPVGLYLLNAFGSWGAVAMVTIWFSASHIASFIYLTRWFARADTLSRYGLKS